MVGGLLLGGLLLSGCCSAGWYRSRRAAGQRAAVDQRATGGRADRRADRRAVWSTGCQSVGCWSAGDWFSLACFGGRLLSRLLSGGLSLVGGRPVGRLSLVGGRLSVGGLLVAGCDGTCGQLPPQKSKFSFYPRHAIRTVEGEISSCAAALLVRRAPPTHSPSRGKREG